MALSIFYYAESQNSSPEAALKRVMFIEPTSAPPYVLIRFLMLPVSRVSCNPKRLTARP